MNTTDFGDAAFGSTYQELNRQLLEFFTGGLLIALAMIAVVVVVVAAWSCWDHWRELRRCSATRAELRALTISDGMRPLTPIAPLSHAWKNDYPTLGARVNHPSN